MMQPAEPPKLVTLNDALLSAMHPDRPPDPAKEALRFGAWVEKACLAFAANQGQRVAYWREEPLELDAVFEGTWGKWAVEIQTGSFDVHPERIAGVLPPESKIHSPGDDRAGRGDCASQSRAAHRELGRIPDVGCADAANLPPISPLFSGPVRFCRVFLRFPLHLPDNPFLKGTTMPSEGF
jgi:hypothetical protein